MTDVRSGDRGVAIVPQLAQQAAEINVEEGFMRWSLLWKCEKWEQDKIDFALEQIARGKLDHADVTKVDGRLWVVHNISGETVVRPASEGLTSDILRALGIELDGYEEIPQNLLLNEGIQRLEDLLIVAGGTGYNNANAFIGVGDTNTAAAATQTELQATQNAANRFYKGMVASYPQRTAQTVDWRSDFTSGEANFAWAEWTISAGATTASGSGFLVGTTNLNRKVESLGTKATGTWTMTASLTIS